MVDVSLWSTTSHLVPRLHEAIPLVSRVSSPPSELLPHKFTQRDDSWMPSDRPRICSTVNYSASSIFTSLREVWKPLASPLSVSPAVSHHQSLVSQREYFLTDYSEPGDKVFSNVVQEIRSGKKPYAIQLVSLGACVCFLPIFWLIPRPRDNLPSHLPFIQT